MFRQIKSAIIWSYIYRFRSLLVKILAAIIVIGVIEYIYGDVVEYFRLTKKVEYLWIVLMIKWILIVLILLYIGYSIWKVGKPKNKKSPQKSDNKKPKKRALELESMSKKEIKNLAQEIIKSKVKRRG